MYMCVNQSKKEAENPSLSLAFICFGRFAKTDEKMYDVYNACTCIYMYMYIYIHVMCMHVYVYTFIH